MSDHEEQCQEQQAKHLEARYRDLLDGKRSHRLIFEQRLREISLRKARRLRLAALARTLGEAILYVAAYIVSEGLLVWILSDWLAPESSVLLARFALYGARLGAVLLVTYVLCRLWQKITLPDLGLHWRSGYTLKRIGLGLGLGSFLACILFLIELLAGQVIFNGFTWRTAVSVLMGLLGSMATTSLIVVTEELMYRGYILQVLQHGWGRAGAATISSLIYSMLYFTGAKVSPFSYLGVFLIGLLLSCAYLIAKDLWTPMSVHWGWHFVLNGVFSLPIGGLQCEGLVLTHFRETSDLVTGNLIGSEASKTRIAFLFCTLLILYLHTWRIRSREIP